MQNNKLEIAVMGLAGIHNAGENFLLSCVSYLVNKSRNCESKIIDLEAPMNWCRSFLYYGVLIISKAITHKTLRAKTEYLAVKIRCGKYYREALKGKNALIFGAGSFKYGTQKLWAYYSLATETAEKLGIPVMFNAMNIQKPDWSNWKCSFLLAHANLPCVRMITTRDGNPGVARLRNEYHIREDIVCECVGDAAFWIPECYHVHQSEKTEKIGINLIYGNIFIRYGNSLTEEALLDAYHGLLNKLDADGIAWELFTNGLPSDYQFGRKLLKRYGNTQIKIQIPQSEHDLLRIISHYKGILGARLHACICAYSLDVPFIGFIWDEKMLNFSRMAGLQDYFILEKDISVDSLYRKMMFIINGNSQIDKEKRQEWKTLTADMIEIFLKNSASI